MGVQYFLSFQDMVLTAQKVGRTACRLFFVHESPSFYIPPFLTVVVDPLLVFFKGRASPQLAWPV